MDQEQVLNALIKEAGWFHGTNMEWQAIPLPEREKLAFAATGCLIAYATWPAPVACLHDVCQVARGEKPPITITENVLTYERQSGWLRWLTPERYQIIHDHIVAKAQETGTYNPWKIPNVWGLMVDSAILS